MLNFCLSFQWYQETIRHFFVSVCVSAAKRQDVTSLSPFSLIPRNNTTFLRFSVCQCSEEERCLSFFVRQSHCKETSKQAFAYFSVWGLQWDWGYGVSLFPCVGTRVRVSVCFRVLARGERERLFPCIGKGWERASIPNSKHWFTTSFHPPLPYLFTPQGPENSANEQFFVGAQTVVSLLQTTQIKQGVSFIAASKVYISTNKTTIVWIETELFLLPGVDASDVYVRALALGCFYSHISTRTFQWRN